ncbi:hypothetical protein [Agrobacterium vitis]|uniref:hypothetical protein n=1 Tax=Agrobacterium vitis TaxID=373 RepID=UPI000872DF8D|nr:hypothetical protein [Agrobacterium vitis]MCE6078160.1 hypothetical protein [Agrobacterium vitis]MCM2449601.1 hypothetical protein [Agrobacterium vitis]MCM2467118.1 hypothetical protein [Agrobacterium vitis]MUO71840.1 hypothetical protein [Agrobacterium vitis]MUO85822.1 hypothetical protein [Agrobacterium vitis]
MTSKSSLPASSTSSLVTAHGTAPRLLPAMLGYCLLVIVVLCATTLPFAKDYVGADNDDAMRLVEVRDYLAGQGWFDMMQYRLGLAPGTLMHWSRLIDWPIATLIRLADIWFAPHTAEAVALAIWPMLWTVPVMLSLGTAGWMLGGRVAMHLALCLSGLYLLTSNRFLPGAIDHHNVQIALVAFLTAVLSTAAPATQTEARSGTRSSTLFALAGAAAALALAIGAETTPLIATACAIVALLWAWHGKAMRACAMAYSLSLALSITLLFVATVPAQSYRTVTCDNLSFGFYALTAIGGGLLFSAAAFASRFPAGVRLFLLLMIGASVGFSALIVAPQCLGNPLASLDPMLVTLWLNNVGEARSVFAMAQQEPGTLGGFYAVGLFGLLVCLTQVWRKNQVEAHLALALLMAVSLGVALIQVRGAMFSNLIPILPLALLVADLRGRAMLRPVRMNSSLAYIAAILLSVPSVWAVAGTLAVEGTARLKPQFRPGAASKDASRDCSSEKALSQLSGLAPTTVAAPSDSGTSILRFTPHRILTAPYHRNQAGMLTELHIGLSTPPDAHAFLVGAHVGILAFCPSDAQTRQLIALKPDGLYADLNRNRVPDYLQPLAADSQSGLRIFLVKPQP